MKWLKLTVGILISLIVIIILSATLLITFVSPNRFKPIIAEQVKKYTGRELRMDGDLSWTIFPYLGVKAGHLELANPPGFKQKLFAEIQSATLGIKILPLFSAKLESSGIVFKGLKLYLIKNESGKTNWEDFQSASPIVKTSSSSTSTPEANKSSIGVALAGVEVTNATVNWINEQTKQYINIENFNLKAKDINLMTPFLVTMHFNMANNDLNAKVSGTSKVSLNLTAQHYRLQQIALLATVNHDSKKFDIHLNGDAAIDMSNRAMMLDNLTMQIANLKMNGQVRATGLGEQVKWMGNMLIQPVDLKKWLEAIGQDTAALQMIRNVSGNIDFMGSSSVNSMSIDGNIKVDELKASHVYLNNINIKAKLKEGMLDIPSFGATFYQGSLDGNAKINLSSSEPQIAIQAKLANVQIEPLLKDLSPNNKLKLTGVGNIHLLLTTAGTAGDVIMKNLNGVGQLSFNNGVLQGIDIGYLLESANALANKQGLPKTNTNETQFGSLTAKAVMTGGVITNDDLYLNAPRFEAHGKGRIDLIKKVIHYNLQASAKQPVNVENKEPATLGVAIPITIAGNLENPNVRMDADALMKTIAQQQLQKSKNQIQKLQEKYKDKIPEGAGTFINKLLGH